MTVPKFFLKTAPLDVGKTVLRVAALRIATQHSCTHFWLRRCRVGRAATCRRASRLCEVRCCAALHALFRTSCCSAANCQANARRILWSLYDIADAEMAARHVIAQYADAQTVASPRFMPLHNILTLTFACGATALPRSPRWL